MGTILAVDAGVHLSAIAKILETHKSTTSEDGQERKVTLIDGPFEGLEIPNSTANANAHHITTSLVDTYLITHPHLDHISGFVVNTAALNGSRPKRLAGLPSTVEAFKTHIFNNVIWPNLSDENGGVGLVTYTRLVEGGSPALGEGDGKGYVEVCEGLSVKTWSVSHGRCVKHNIHGDSNASVASHFQHMDTAMRSPGIHGTQMARSASGSSLAPGDVKKDHGSRNCVVDSSAYFIRDIATGKEVLIFGDVEPDSISNSPRNRRVWSEAAPKIVSGQLGGVFIECSYDDSRATDSLFGHLAPRFLMEELTVLAQEVQPSRSMGNSKKRKHVNSGDTLNPYVYVLPEPLASLHTMSHEY